MGPEPKTGVEKTNTSNRCIAIYLISHGCRDMSFCLFQVLKSEAFQPARTGWQSAYAVYNIRAEGCSIHIFAKKTMFS